MSISSPFISATNRVLIALISFIMNFYLLFRVNFLYSKVVGALISYNKVVIKPTKGTLISYSLCSFSFPLLIVAMAKHS